MASSILVQVYLSKAIRLHTLLSKTSTALFKDIQTEEENIEWMERVLTGMRTATQLFKGQVRVGIDRGSRERTGSGHRGGSKERMGNHASTPILKLKTNLGYKHQTRSSAPKQFVPFDPFKRKPSNSPQLNNISAKVDKTPELTKYLSRNASPKTAQPAPLRPPTPTILTKNGIRDSSGGHNLAKQDPKSAKPSQQQTQSRIHFAPAQPMPSTPAGASISRSKSFKYPQFDSERLLRAPSHNLTHQHCASAILKSQVLADDRRDKKGKGVKENIEKKNDEVEEYSFSSRPAEDDSMFRASLKEIEKLGGVSQEINPIITSPFFPARPLPIQPISKADKKTKSRPNVDSAFNQYYTPRPAIQQSIVKTVKRQSVTARNFPENEVLRIQKRQSMRESLICQKTSSPRADNPSRPAPELKNSSSLQQSSLVPGPPPPTVILLPVADPQNPAPQKRISFHKVI